MPDKLLDNLYSMKYRADHKSFYWFSDAHYRSKKELRFKVFSYQAPQNADWTIHIITRPLDDRR